MPVTEDLISQILVIGAGPAGLTAAYALARSGRPSTVIEAATAPGGIAKTVEYLGSRYDLGGHRFFSKSAEVESLWDELASEPLLVRSRLSRIFYDGKFYDYPLKIGNALRNMGPVTASQVLGSYVAARVHPGVDDTFEGWVTNRFGRRLYKMFFESYTEKVWGRPCSELSAEWAAQRIKNLSLSAAVKDAVFGKRGGDVMSLIDQFRYPRLGPGQLWQDAAEKCRAAGCDVRLQERVVAFEMEAAVRPAVTAVLTQDDDGARRRYRVDHVISSMPVRDLVAALPDKPVDVASRAAGLEYRGFIAVALALDTGDLFPDNWVYVHSSQVRIGRVQNFGNWSPDLLASPGTSLLGAEFFSTEGDDLWLLSDDRLIDLAWREVREIGLVSRGRLLYGHVTRVPDAYPVYATDQEKSFAPVRGWLSSLRNLQCVGRNGQHRYNNMDHSMITALIAAENIENGYSRDPWAVNQEADYHEAGKQVG